MKKALISCLLVYTLGIGTACKSQNNPISDEEEVTLVANGFEFTEGPAADPEGNVFFTDQPNNEIVKWSVEDSTVSVFMKDAGRSNGLYFSNKAQLLACADENNELWLIDPSNKNITVLVDSFRGKKLNGPNDLWVDPQGGIYFTDPYYQRPYWERESPEIKKERVYYLAPGEKEPVIAADGLTKPNGIIGTPDGKTLYVADIGDDKTFSYSIDANGSLSNKQLFTDLGSDGMTIDNHGNVYLTGDGVSVFDKKGDLIHHIEINEDWTANVTFGGPDHRTLFITAMDSLYSLETKVKGVRW